MKDLELIAATFLTSELPKDKEYLSKYFRGLLQERVLSYYLIFTREEGTFKWFYRNFIDHTGMACAKRHLYFLMARIRKIEARLAKAEKEKDHETIALIKMGKYKHQPKIFRKKNIFK
jgi:hypothetical protein